VAVKAWTSLATAHRECPRFRHGRELAERQRLLGGEVIRTDVAVLSAVLRRHSRPMSSIGWLYEVQLPRSSIGPAASILFTRISAMTPSASRAARRKTRRGRQARPVSR
jgi:hypothetical protein